MALRAVKPPNNSHGRALQAEVLHQALMSACPRRSHHNTCAMFGALQAWMPTGRVVSTMLRLTAVPAPRQAFPSGRALWAGSIACTAPNQPPAQLVRKKTMLQWRRQALPSQPCPAPHGMQARKKKRRLDEVCLERHPEYSRNVIQSWIAQGSLAAVAAFLRRSAYRHARVAGSTAGMPLHPSIISPLLQAKSW